MKKLLLAFILLATFSKAQTGCNASFSPITICYPSQTKVIGAGVQTDMIYLCGVNSVVWDTFNPPSIKYRQVFVNTGAVYNIKSTAGNHQVTIWAKSGSTVNLMAGTNLAFTTVLNKETGTTLINGASSGSLTNNTCSVVIGPSVNCTATGIAENQSITSETIVWPNPTAGKLFINAKSEEKAAVSLTVINQLGEIILTEDYFNTGKKELSLEKYPTGIYFVRVKSGSTVETRKIILLK